MTGAHAKRKTSGRAFVVVGVALVAAAVAVFAWQAAGVRAAEGRSGELCSQILGELDERVPVTAAAAGLDVAALPVLELRGVDVVARLQVATIGLDVPVAAEGSDAALVPTRVARADGDEGKVLVAGSTYQGDGAWERIGELAGGEHVTLTGMTGASQEYVVVSAGRTKADFDDDFDLLMYYEDELGNKTWAGCTKVS